MPDDQADLVIEDPFLEAPQQLPRDFRLRARPADAEQDCQRPARSRRQLAELGRDQRAVPFEVLALRIEVHDPLRNVSLENREITADILGGQRVAGEEHVRGTDTVQVKPFGDAACRREVPDAARGGVQGRPRSRHVGIADDAVDVAGVVVRFRHERRRVEGRDHGQGAASVQRQALDEVLPPPFADHRVERPHVPVRPGHVTPRVEAQDLLQHVEEGECRPADERHPAGIGHELVEAAHPLPERSVVFRYVRVVVGQEHASARRKTAEWVRSALVAVPHLDGDHPRERVRRCVVHVSLLTAGWYAARRTYLRGAGVVQRHVHARLDAWNPPA